jgi:hypothetical protein
MGCGKFTTHIENFQKFLRGVRVSLYILFIAVSTSPSPSPMVNR